MQLWARICPAELESKFFNKFFFPFYSVRETETQRDTERETEIERGHLEHIPQRRLTTPRTKTLLRVDYSLSSHSPSYQTGVPFPAAHASCPCATTSRRTKRLADPKTDLDCKRKSRNQKKKTPPPTNNFSKSWRIQIQLKRSDLSLMHCRWYTTSVTQWQLGTKNNWRKIDWSIDSVLYLLSLMQLWRILASTPMIKHVL